MSETVTIVWAFQPLDELDGQTGLVECDEALAQRLITADLAQDPRVGSNHFRDIVQTAQQATPSEQVYQTRVLQAQQHLRDRKPTPKTTRKPARKPQRER
jgi:hypothetical protein